MDVQYWLLPIDENNLRCQAAGYRSLKDYFITKGLKLRKWKETGLIKELVTTTGTKIKFGKYIQYSKICLPYVKVACDDVEKDFYLDSVLKTPRTPQASVKKKLASQYSCTHQKMRQTDSATEQQQSSYSQSVIKTRPQSARPASREKTKVYPLHRAKTIYLSPMATRSIASVSETTNIPYSESQKPQEKVNLLHSPKKKGSTQNTVPSNFTVKSTPNFKKQMLNAKYTNYCKDNINQESEVGGDMKIPVKPRKQKKESNFAPKNIEKSSVNSGNSSQKMKLGQLKICDENFQATSKKDQKSISAKSDYTIRVVKADNTASSSLHKIPLFGHEVGSKEVKQLNIVKNKLAFSGNKADSKKLNKHSCRPSPNNPLSNSKQKNQVQTNHDLCSAGDQNIQSIKSEAEINNRETNDVNENVCSTKNSVSVPEQKVNNAKMKQELCLQKIDTLLPEKSVEYICGDLNSSESQTTLSKLKTEAEGEFQVACTSVSKKINNRETNNVNENVCSTKNSVSVLEQKVNDAKMKQELCLQKIDTLLPEKSVEYICGDLNSSESQTTLSELKTDTEGEFQVVCTPMSKNSISEENLEIENAFSSTNKISFVNQEAICKEKWEDKSYYENSLSELEVKSEKTNENFCSEKQTQLEESNKPKIIKQEYENFFLVQEPETKETKQIACLSDKENLNAVSVQEREIDEIKQDLCYNIRITLSEKNVEVNIQEECSIKNQTSLELKKNTLGNVPCSSKDASESKETFSSGCLVPALEQKAYNKEIDHTLDLGEGQSSILDNNPQFENKEDLENMCYTLTSLQEKKIHDSKTSFVPKPNQWKEDNIENYCPTSEEKIESSKRLTKLITTSHVKYNRRFTTNGFLEENKVSHKSSKKQTYSDPSLMDKDAGNSEELAITEMLKKGFKVTNKKSTAQSQITINILPNKGTQLIKSKNELEMTEIVKKGCKVAETTSSVAESQFSLQISPSNHSLQSKNSSTYLTGSESSFSMDGSS